MHSASPVLDVPPQPSEAVQPLALLEELRATLAAHGVRYCQWKGHWKRFRWACGDGDIDVLVDRTDLSRFGIILEKLGLNRKLPEAPERMPGVFHYYGLDAATNRLIHVHTFSQLIVGNDPTAMYHLPIEKPFLDSVQTDSFFPVPAPEFELIVFVIRSVLGYSVETMLRPKLAARLKLDQAEFRYLHARVEETKLQAIRTQWFPFLDTVFFERCIQSQSSNCSAWERLTLKRRLQRKLKPHALGHGAFVYLRWMGSRLLNRMRSHFRRRVGA